MNKCFNINVILQNLVLLLLVNIIIDVTYLISGIYTNFCTFLCKNCDVGYYVISYGVYTIYCVVIKFLRQNKGYSTRRSVK